MAVANLAAVESGVVESGVDENKNLLNKQNKNYSSNENDEEEKEITFWQWLFKNPLSKLPFVYFLVGILGVPALAVFNFMDADTAFIISGGYIALNIFGYKHFYTLIGLKKEVDQFGSLNRKFAREHSLLSGHVDRLEHANKNLSESQNRIRVANARNRENLSGFRELQDTMKKMQLESIDQLSEIQKKANKIGDKWQDQLIEHERDMLHTIFDRFEEASGKSGMTISEFEQFSEQLPQSYKQRFERLGTFKSISKDGVHLTFDDFDAVLDVYAEMEATECDIEFTIQPTDDKKDDKNNLLNDDDDDKSDEEELEDISLMKRWKTTRKRKERDAKQKKVIIQKRTLRTEVTRDFVTGLGFTALNLDQRDSAHTGTPHGSSSDDDLPFTQWERGNALNKQESKSLIDALSPKRKDNK